MKTCRKCLTPKPLDAFHRRGDGHQTWCKTCANANRMAHYQANREHEIARNRDWAAREREWYNGLKGGPCTGCGGTFHYSAMQWDHRPGESKTACVASMMQMARGRKAILEEIAKCDLVCANCHAVRTWTRAQATGR